ncbi:MAG: histidine kinase N-terminal 7TM domain-containing protein [Lachnospiraceae bacterium]
MLQIKNLKKYRAFFGALLAVIAAAMIRQVGYHVNEQLNLFCIILRSSIYIGLFAAWSISVSNRIIQPQVRRYLIAISLLIVFWIVIRGIKHSMDVSPWVLRHLWYLYYLPMLFIPVLLLFVAFALGKPDNLRLPKWINLLYIPSDMLLLFVLTNDLHQLVFRFPKDAVVWMNDYRYGIVYFFEVGWMVLCAMMALVIMMTKCRVPHSRKVLVLPFIPIIMALIYAVCYVLHVWWLRVIAGDMTVVFCLLFAAVLESCIQCGLIQSNTRYEELFSKAADIPAQITDNDYTIRYASKDAQRVQIEQMRAAEKEPVMLSDGKRLHNMPIRGGHVIWTEDMRELLSLREKLEDIQEELADRNGLLQLEYEREKEHKVVEEQNRLYDLLQQSTQIQIDKISILVSRYQNSTEPDEKRNILSRIAVLGSFMKRRKDMILCIDSTPIMPVSKLTGALGESYRSLSRMGVRGSYLVDTGKEYQQGETLALAYDFFEDAVETTMDSLRSIDVRVTSVRGKLRISIFADGDGDFSELRQKYPYVFVDSETDGTELLLYLEGGEPV